MSAEDYPLIQRAETAVAEAARLREALEQLQGKIRQQAERLARIETELDPLQPHPAEELGEVRALLAREPREEGQHPFHAGQLYPG